MESVKEGIVNAIEGTGDVAGAMVDFKTGVRWAGSRFAPKIALALRKALAEEEEAGQKIDTFGISFGFDLGKQGLRSADSLADARPAHRSGASRYNRHRAAVRTEPVSP